jgi:DNA-binding response OmpR family regulator
MPKVLIVDDEPDILLMLRVNLESEGYETALAADGETALRRIDEGHPDVMLLDVMMPVMDGWSVLEHLTDRDDGPRIVVLSAKTAARDVVRALTLGAADYLTKPFEWAGLLKTVSRVLSSSDADLDEYRQAVIGRLDGEDAG